MEFYQILGKYKRFERSFMFIEYVLGYVLRFERYLFIIVQYYFNIFSFVCVCVEGGVVKIKVMGIGVV